MPNDPTSHPPDPTGASDRGLKLRMASEARRVHSQHEQLSALIADLKKTFETGTDRMVRSSFEHFADAFDAHMRVEETLYFPALHGLLPGVDADLIALADEHHELRDAVDEVRTKLAAHDTPGARALLAALSDRRAAHEAIEETLIERVRTTVGHNGNGNSDSDNGQASG